MAHDKNLRFSIETISIYYKNSQDIIIIGSFNDPNGPRRACGTPIILNQNVTAKDIGNALKNMYYSCLNFNKTDIECDDPYKKIPGFKNWKQFALKHQYLAIAWYKNGKIEIEKWEWAPEGGFSPPKTQLQSIGVNADDPDDVIGEAVLSLIQEE